jgi:hypothetical protein
MGPRKASPMDVAALAHALQRRRFGMRVIGRPSA